MNSEIVGASVPFFNPSATCTVLWNVPSVKRGDAIILSSRSPLARAPIDGIMLTRVALVGDVHLREEGAALRDPWACSNDGQSRCHAYARDRLETPGRTER